MNVRDLFMTFGGPIGPFQERQVTRDIYLVNVSIALPNTSLCKRNRDAHDIQVFLTLIGPV